ncbi:trace amine-associated receptor 13c-like [Thalassophryne amazonica]|uniref:trace amine-associated receptor 13c-like n=1 Tax=Thalassophryne amazonica TaxID=390379 RepID=UPI001471EC06|nr:trace amine-associated receptor 13c-like [Thalassophryne amazonica]
METVEGADLCAPQLLNTSCKKPKQPPTEAMVIYTVPSFISVLTVLLNLLVIIAISHFRQLHSLTNLLLLSLAGSDLLVGLLLMAVEIIYIEACWFLGDLVCTLYYVLDYLIASASVANMVLISLDRFVAICDPVKYHLRVTQRRVQLAVIVCWICCIFYFALLLHDHLLHPGKSNTCFGQCVVVIDHIAGIVDLVITFIIPISVIVVLYLRVFVVAVIQVRAICSHVMAAKLQHSRNVFAKKSELKAAWTLGIVVIVFLICFCPYHIPAFAGQDTAIDASSAAFEIWLAHFNSYLNPIIYVFCYPWFRKSVKLIATLQILKPDSRYAKVL